MGHVEIRIKRATIVTDTKMFVLRWETLQKVLRDQSVEGFKSVQGEGVLAFRRQRGGTNCTASVVVGDFPKYHDRLQEKNE